ncbi:recombination protein NinB [Massilia sp. PWRC2]|uniref:recombination protein NinB n=1 Tax=Massilia sp. PWRC2 TaxID=2804626 RepID=UPI003CE6A808
MKRTFILVHNQARQNALRCVAEADFGMCVTVCEPTRSLEQNALMWPLLDRLAKQVVWYGVKLTSEDWKDILTASLRKQRTAPGIDGGFVVFGERTKTYSKAQLSELIELIYAFGAQHGVEFENTKEIA